MSTKSIRVTIIGVGKKNKAPRKAKTKKKHRLVETAKVTRKRETR